MKFESVILTSEASGTKEQVSEAWSPGSPVPLQPHSRRQPPCLLAMDSWTPFPPLRHFSAQSHPPHSPSHCTWQGAGQAHADVCTLSMGEQRPFPCRLESTWHAGHVAGWLGELLTYPSQFPHDSGMEAGCLGFPSCYRAEQMVTGRSDAWLELVWATRRFLVQRLEWGGSSLNGPRWLIVGWDAGVQTLCSNLGHPRQQF